MNGTKVLDSLFFIYPYNIYMASSGQQVKNGKAFEYAIAKTYYDYMVSLGLPVDLVDNVALKTA